MTYYYYRTFMNTFWSEQFWLPPNTTWADLAPDARTEVQHTDYRHLLYPLPLSIVFLLLRYLLEKYWFAPVGILIGVKNNRPKCAPNNPILEKAYVQSKIWKQRQIQGLAKQVDLTERQVERWLRLRKGQDKPTTLTKFCENAWRCLYYSFSFFYGILVLWDKPWLWNINECWIGFPHQSLTNDVWWYYMFSMAFYWSLLISQFSDAKRKDFWQMFAHHVATILLLCLSWVVNVFRIGSLVLVVHDISDIFLEIEKMAQYSGHQTICDIMFAVFTILWIVSRIVIYPFWILRSTTIDANKFVPPFPAYYVFNGLLLLLLVLHCVWTYYILIIAGNTIKSGHMERDVRSSSDDDREDSKLE